MPSNPGILSSQPSSLPQELAALRDIVLFLQKVFVEFLGELWIATPEVHRSPSVLGTYLEHPI